ncbi:MAG: LysR family transcriptional regulator [Kiloniellales bacterium]
MKPGYEISVFLDVVERGSFAAVAETMGLTPPGVSKIVSRLEDHLGVKLLQRSTRRLALTPEGEIYAARAREIVGALTAAEAEVTAGRNRPRGTLRVNTGSAFAKLRLARWLPEFVARYPEITVDLSVTDRRVDLAAEGIDLAIRVGPLSDSSLVGRRLGEVRRVIAASPDYLVRQGTPRRPQDLLQHNCLLLSGFARLAKWPFLVKGRRVALPVGGSLTSDNAECLYELALGGAGIVRLGDFLGEEALADGRLLPLFETSHDPEPRPITILTPPALQRLPRIRAFMDFLQEKQRG